MADSYERCSAKLEAMCEPRMTDYEGFLRAYTQPMEQDIGG